MGAIASNSLWLCQYRAHRIEAIAAAAVVRFSVVMKLAPGKLPPCALVELPSELLVCIMSQGPRTA